MSCIKSSIYNFLRPKMLTKRIKTHITFNGNYIEYKSNRNKDKNLSPKEYLDTIKLYLSNIINNRKK